MAFMKTSDKFRFKREAEESPTTFSSLQLQANNKSNSPMTDLALNLSDARVAGSPMVPLRTPRRRLSLSSDGSPSPQPLFLHTAGLDHMAMEVDHRLLKNAIKFPGVGKDFSSGRHRSFSRRISLTVNNENIGLPFSDKENQDMEQTSSHSGKPNISPSKFAMKQQVSPLRPRQPLEDQDPNSQDSGYGASYPDKVDPKTGFRFTEPFALGPRKHLSENTLLKENTTSPHSKSPHHATSSQKLLRSWSSGSGSDCLDDGFLEFDDKLADVGNLPVGLNSLLCKPILRDEVSFNTYSISRGEEKTRLFRRHSLVENVTPNCSRFRSCLISDPGSPMQQDEETCASESDSMRTFKRPDPPCDYISPSQHKRRKANSLYSISENTITNELNLPAFKMTQIKFQRSFSESEANIKTALHRSLQEPDLIGDFTKPYILPLTEGRHQDLKTITSETLANLMNGHYNESIEMFTIVDCRYPYEFEGGHIKGAKNIYTKDQVLTDLVNGMQAEAKSETSTSVKRKHIMVFHCEFSSERGPSLYRFLRNSDRTKNEEYYPALYYPELYLLDGGYKQFYEHHGAMCEPQDYRPMLHPSHEGDLRHFRAKTKSWNGDSKSRLALRNNPKRLGIL